MGLEPCPIDHRLRIVSKTADETINNSDVLQNDNDLAIALTANTIWKVFIFLLVDSPAAQDIKVHFTGSATTKFEWNYLAGSTASTLHLADTQNLATANAVTNLIPLYGICRVGATAGTLQLQWAQNVAAAVDTSVLEGSVMELVRIA